MTEAVINYTVMGLTIATSYAIIQKILITIDSRLSKTNEVIERENKENTRHLIMKTEQKVSEIDEGIQRQTSSFKDIERHFYEIQAIQKDTNENIKRLSEFQKKFAETIKDPFYKNCKEMEFVYKIIEKTDEKGMPLIYGACNVEKAVKEQTKHLRDFMEFFKNKE